MNPSYNASTNSSKAASSAISYYFPDTSAVAWIMAAVSVLTLLFNGLLIFVYFTNRSLRTPFGFYIISLAVGEFLQTVILAGPNVLSYLQVPWPLGKPICAIVFYSSWAIVGYCLNMHLIICVNRLWAVNFANHYRMHHNRRLALSLVVALLIYVNLWTLPGFVLYAEQYYSEEVYSQTGCHFGGAPDLEAWLGCEIVTMYLVPNVLVMVIYPVIYRKVQLIRSKSKEERPTVQLATLGVQCKF